MVYSKQNAAFINDKNQFFNQLAKVNDMENKLAETMEQADAEATKHDYKFLLENQISLEAEFTQLFAVLQKQKDENNKAFWMYCYYCASLLEAFYKAYSHPAKVSEYSSLKAQIKNRLLNRQEQSAPTEQHFIQSLLDSFTASLRNLKNAPFHTSMLRDYVAFSNVCRLYWVFCRLTLVNGLALAKELHFIEQIDAILGTHTDVDKIVSVMQAPNGVLNYLSIGFFLGRFLIDAGTLIRHTFFPTDEENKSNTSAYERFKYELYKRHWNFTNDLVWATVNFLTNFNHITHIPGPIAGGVTAVFLGFDVCMTLYRLHLLKQEHLVKKAQYLQERADYHDDKKFEGMPENIRLKHIALLDQQLQELDIDLKTKEAKFYFATAAASLLMLGFSTALIFSPPGIIIASYFACTIAISMYLSTGIYAKYQEKSLRLEYAALEEKNECLAREEFTAARDDFIFTMAKNIIVPSVLITTFAICWPAAIALTVVYFGCELMHSSDQHHRNTEIQKLASPENFRM